MTRNGRQNRNKNKGKKVEVLIMRKANVKKADKKQVELILKDEKLSKSAKVRALFDGGLEVKEIATLLDIRYNFAYNVLQNHVIMNDIKVEKTERASKKDDIIKLLQEGKKIVDVCKATKTNYNYVWKISSELKAAAKAAEDKKEAK